MTFPEAISKYETKFKFYLKLPLRKYLHPIFGFDVVKLDQDLGVPDGKSTEDIVLERFGKDAVALCMELIDLDLRETIRIGG